MKMQRKVGAGGSIGLPLAVVVTWVWNSAMPETQMTPEVSTALGAILTWLAIYLIPNPK